MKKMILTSFFVLAPLLFSTTNTLHATTIEFFGATSQIGSILEVDINGTMWDATFYDRLLYAPQPEAYTFGFARDASQALYDLFHTSAFSYYDTNPEYTWGIESATIGHLVTPYYINFVDSYPDYWATYGALFTNKSLTGDYITDSYLLNDYPASAIFTFIQWSESIVVEEPPTPDPDPNPAPVPEPSTVLLLGSGLVGLSWYGRKRKKA